MRKIITTKGGSKMGKKHYSRTEVVIQSFCDNDVITTSYGENQQATEVGIKWGWTPGNDLGSVE